MIVDSSALIAILKDEPEAKAFKAAILGPETVAISAATYFEASIVVDGYKDPRLRARFDAILEATNFLIEPFTAEQAQIARQAYRDYGHGSGHRANLNFGDCFAYALARVKREPLLYKGDDFVHTDIRPAVQQS
ncbi:type II toxin-antitoxin system VapC family toxin [Acidicapsa acidisoli]|uniref:type II toxin-antitoxin system VapC family toxin n=1 Tax=Acidicapsa acidisoli TaxID=1615681 RepID=UPI0021E04C28|nr:type II toxin-antitoxin system VapC family toxin [Acidicapsa acidisoli]